MKTGKVMNMVLMNKKSVRSNRCIRKAQKEAKKFYGRTRGDAPKLKINTMVHFSKNEYVSLLNENTVYDGFAQQNNHAIQLKEDDFISLVKESGLVGLSGNGFLTGEKLKTIQETKAKNRVLIINSVECDPILIHDKWILSNKWEQVKQGIEILHENLQFIHIILATKEQTQSLSFDLGLNGDNGQQIKVKTVPNRYPMGQEKQLIKNVLGMELSNNDIPAQMGILVLNVQTIYAIAQIVGRKEKVHSRFITVADLNTAIAKTVEVSIGAVVTKVIEAIFSGVKGQDIYTGSGIMSCHKAEEKEIVTMQTNFIAYGVSTNYDEANKCGKCGACSSKCPVGVKVHKIVQAVEEGRNNGLEEFHPEKCIGCGACTYVCHAGRNNQRDIAMVNGKLV